MKRLWAQFRGGPLIVFLLTLFVVAAVPLLADRQAVQAGPPLQGDEGDHAGERCADCHLDYKAVWETGVHSIAFERESFQEAWAEYNNSEDCLLCHTTNYQPYDDTFFAENVTCEACHGINPEDHPPADMVVDRDAQMCGQCHTGTFSEWRRSPHAFNEEMGTVACSTCHNPHGQTVRFEDTTELCLNCHEAAPTTYVHLTHNEIEFEEMGITLDCADCHMHRTQGLGDGVNDDVVGHNIPNHTMEVTTSPCTDCHEQLSLTGEFPTLVDVDQALAEERNELREQVGELETALEEQITEQQEASFGYVQLTQGLIVGLGLGITLAWVLLRRANGNEPVNNDRDNKPQR